MADPRGFLKVTERETAKRRPTVATANHGVVYVWYDNENGYSHQVTRIAGHMMLEKRPSYPR